MFDDNEINLIYITLERIFNNDYPKYTTCDSHIVMLLKRVHWWNKCGTRLHQYWCRCRHHRPR